MVQKQPYGFAAGPRTGQQHECDLPVVELGAIRIFGVNRSLEATRTMLEVAGVALVAIEDSDPDSAMVRQCFVSLQPVIDMMNSPPQALGIQQGVHTSDGVGTAYALPEPVTEKVRASGKFQSIETTHSCPEQNRDGLNDDGGRNTRLQAPVDDVGVDTTLSENRKNLL